MLLAMGMLYDINVIGTKKSRGVSLASSSSQFDLLIMQCVVTMDQSKVRSLYTWAMTCCNGRCGFVARSILW
jgi:hypothetical protein